MAKPVAGDDFATISSNDHNGISGNILSNDSAGSILKFVGSERIGPKGGDGIIEGKYGTFTFKPDGSYTYIIDQNKIKDVPVGETVRETLSYKVSDGSGATDYALMHVDIKSEANHRPVAHHDTFDVSTADDVVIGNLLSNDTDPDGNDLVVSYIGKGSPLTYIPTGTEQTYHGVYGDITIGRDGNFVYDLHDDVTLAPDQTIKETFTYKIYDGGYVNSADQDTVTITIHGSENPAV